MSTKRKASALATVWQHRGLLRELTIRDFQNRYAGSVAGALWAFANPLIMLTIYAVVFEHVFKVAVPTLGANQPYVLFVAAALWPWLAFQEAVLRGTLAVQNHGALVKKVAFPHELVVYSAVLASFVVQYCGFALVLLLLAALGYAVSFWHLPVLLIAAFTSMVLAAAVALVLGALQVFIRDTEQLLTQAMSVLFYATPILYSMTSVPQWLASVMQWNPLVHVFETMRNALLNAAGINWASVGWMLLAAPAVLYLARRFFLKLSPHFEDMV